jgi:hypothetical protein
MSSSFRRPSPATVIAIAALVVATSGVAIGSFAPRNGKIVACYSKKTGALRLVEEGKKCRRGEQKIAWNQQGKRGLRGPRGRAGDDGFDGLDGFDGFDGADGADGADAASMLTGSFRAPADAGEAFAAPSGVQTDAGTESERATLSPAVETVGRDLAVELAQDAAEPGAAVLTFTLRANEADTELTCSMTGAERSCQSSSTGTLPAASRLTLEYTTTVTGTARVFRFGWRATTP